MGILPDLSRRRFLGLIGMSGTWLAAGRFHGSRASRRSDRGRLRLVFYTDVHATPQGETPLALERATRAINRQRPDMVIAGGDLILDGFHDSGGMAGQQWESYMIMHHAIDADIYPVVGNRDLVAVMPSDGGPPGRDPRADFRTRLGVDRTFFSFDARGYHAVILDSVRVTGDEMEYHGGVSPDQVESLREDLSKVPRNVPIILATHLPILTSFFAATGGSTASAPDNRVVVNGKEILDFLGPRNLLLALQGHLHVSELLRWRNTTFITGGAVCGNWWKGPFYGTEEGFCSITLRGDTVEWEYVEYEWYAPCPADP